MEENYSKDISVAEELKISLSTQQVKSRIIFQLINMFTNIKILDYNIRCE